MDIAHFPLRSALIKHAAEEHQDYQMLENDYINTGGRKEEIINAKKNIGSEALSSFIFYRASQINPLDLFGSIFIIEGLGHMVSGPFAKLLQATLDLKGDQISFLTYHDKNDGNHYEKLVAILCSPFITHDIAELIIKTAKVTGRLYVLQIDELNHF